MPISTGLPRQSLIFWRLLFRVMIFRESFLLPDSLAEDAAALPPKRMPMALEPLSLPDTSPLWLSLVLAAGFTAVQKGFTK